MKKHLGLVIAGFTLVTAMSAHTFGQATEAQDKKTEPATMPGQPNTAKPDPGQMGPGKMGAIPMAQMGQVKPAAPSARKMGHKKPRKGHKSPDGTMSSDRMPAAGH